MENESDDEINEETTFPAGKYKFSAKGTWLKLTFFGSLDDCCPGTMIQRMHKQKGEEIGGIEGIDTLTAVNETTGQEFEIDLTSDFINKNPVSKENECFKEPYGSEIEMTLEADLTKGFRESDIEITYLDSPLEILKSFTVCNITSNEVPSSEWKDDSAEALYYMDDETYSDSDLEEMLSDGE